MVYVIEYIDLNPVAEYALSGVSAGLGFIEEQESLYPNRKYRLAEGRMNERNRNVVLGAIRNCDDSNRLVHGSK